MDRAGDIGLSRDADEVVERAPARPSARDEILKLQRQLYRRQKALIEGSVRGVTPAFRAYERRFERGVADYERVARFEDVVTQAAKSDVVYVGDYHTLRQAQRAYAKLVQRLVARGRPVVMALEFMEARHQESLERYISGRLSEPAFLARIGHAWEEAFDVWPNFRPLFELARTHQLPVVGLERANGGPLDVRDRFSARRLAHTVKAHPGAVVVVLAGQLHCAPAHLPAQTKAALARSGKSIRQLCVYQNAEALWFKLERQGLEQVTEAVRVREGEYCLFNTSPLVAQQSYLDWVEDGELVETTQPERHFKELARLIARFLRLDAKDALEEVEVYTAGDLSFLERLKVGGLFTRPELALVRRQILSRESYYIPRAKIAYLAGLSLNHAAEEAAHFLRHAATGEMEPERGLVDSFYARALEEAFAFFGSKLVNPRRKTAHPEDFERLRRTATGGDKRVAELVLAHLAVEKDGHAAARRKVYDASDVDLFNAVTHSLGYILGDRMYHALIQGELLREEAHDLYCEPFDGDGEAFKLYFALARRFAHVVVPRHP